MICHEGTCSSHIWHSLASCRYAERLVAFLLTEPPDMVCGSEDGPSFPVLIEFVRVTKLSTWGIAYSHT
jgi:hypothetical protein